MIRNRFFAGRLLTAEDFNLEQKYFREKHKRHNRTLHGFGVVTGLDVSKSYSPAVPMTPALTIDCEGNKISLKNRSLILFLRQRARPSFSSFAMLSTVRSQSQQQTRVVTWSSQESKKHLMWYSRRRTPIRGIDICEDDGWGAENLTDLQ